MLIQSMPAHLANAILVTFGVCVFMFMIMSMASALLLIRCFHKPAGDHMLVRTGYGGTRACFAGGIISYPMLHELCRVYSGVVLLKHPDTGTDWPVKLVPDESHAIKAMRSFGSKPEQDIKTALQAIADQHKHDPEQLEASLANVGYAQVG